MAWVNFRELREKLDFRDVLAHYGVEVNAKNHIQHHGKCPLPTHEGSQRTPSFSANLDKKIWRCFRCGAQGNILDFACLMERLNPERSDDLRQVALQLGHRFGFISETPKPTGEPTKKVVPTKNSSVPLTNVPLDFELKGLDPAHPYFAKRGLTPETVAHFGLGCCARGLMQGRIAIPLRNPKGQLIGYAGRVIDDTLITDENPKYRFPAPREHEGKRFEFSKSLFLYNGHSVAAPAEDVIVVEGFASVWWLHQHGQPNVVGLMGANASPEQAALIVGMVPRRGRVWVFSDGNQAGRYCAEGLFRLVAPYRFIRWIELQDGRKPTSCNADELRTLLE
jgi:DNA primase